MKNIPLFRIHQITICIASALVIQAPAMAEEQSSTKSDKLVVSAQALKVNTALQETPKSISIISEKDLELHAPQKIDEALRYTSGVVAQPYGADNDTDWFKVRGFDAATYLDNSRLYRDGYYTWLLEPYGLESIEVVKGASAVLFGESTPGGAINLVTKKPSLNTKNELFLEAGNNDYKALGFDLSTSSTSSDIARYRLVSLIKKSDGELKHTDNKRIYFAPSAAFDLSESTMLTLMATYLHDDGTPTNPFFPASGTLTHSKYGKIKPSTNFGEPDYDKYKRTQFSVGYLLEHQIDSQWRFAQRLNYGYNDLTLRSIYVYPNSDPDKQILDRGIIFRDGKNQSFSFDNNFVGEWDSGLFENTLLAGVEFQYHQTKGDEQNGGFGTINPWKPEYGKYTPLNPANNVKRTIDKTQTSLYSQYQTKFDSKWIGVAGARYDWVKTENKLHQANEHESRHDGEMSLNAGLMYIADNGLSPYLNYSQSFEVQSTVDPTTQHLYKPLKGEQIEVGIKYTPYFIDGYLNVAWFDIEQKNALVTNPSTSVATQTGKVTSQGVESELFAQLTDQWDIKATYTYTNAQTDNTNGQGRKQSGLIPKHAATAWTSYEIPTINDQSLKLGTGVRYLGESKDMPASSDLTVPSATLWDMAAVYQLSNNWQLQFNMNNILNKEYIASCDYWCYFGQSRSFVFQTKYSW